MENTLNDLQAYSNSNIENVDFAFYDWVDKDLNLFCNTKDGFSKVATMWVTPERAFQVKMNKEFRDVNGTLNLPMITIERTAIEKDVKNNGALYTNLQPKDNRRIVGTRINQKKTSEFANADSLKRTGNVTFLSPRRNNKVVYKFKEVLLPVYAMFTYSISIFTQFQQQMNELLQPFLARTGSIKYFVIERDGSRYECFIDGNFQMKNNIASMEEEERRYMTTISIKVLANLISEGVNENVTYIKTYENAVEVKLNKDKIAIGGVPSAASASNILRTGNTAFNGGQNTLAGGYSGGGASEPVATSSRIIIDITEQNSIDDLTKVYHNKNKDTLKWDGWYYDNNVIGSLISTHAEVYDTYIEVQGLEIGHRYLFIVTG
jgi:hypothetical protein